MGCTLGDESVRDVNPHPAAIWRRPRSWWGDPHLRTPPPWHADPGAGSSPGSPPGGRRLPAFALAVLGLALLGAPCRPGGFQTIAVDAPVDGLLVDDPGGPFAGAARVGTNFDAVTVEIRLDGVDLVSGLGLTAPFSGASGVLMVGADLVTVSDFSFAFTNPRTIDFHASGLSLGTHTLEVEGEKLQGGLGADAASFEVLEPFTLAARDLPAASRGPQDAGSEGAVFSSSLGQPLASPPIGLSGGGSVRSGFQEVSEAFVAGGAP